jgi:hypothetical protein
LAAKKRQFVANAKTRTAQFTAAAYFKRQRSRGDRRTRRTIP